MRPPHPADRVHEIERVLILKLVRGRRRPDLKAGTPERELVNGFRDVVCGPVDAQVRHCHGRHIDQAVVDVHEPKPEIIDERGREEVRFVHAKKPPAHGNVVGKIQIRGADTARQRSSQRRLQAARAKWQQRFRIREKKPCRNLVLRAMELTVPVGRELIVGILPRLADDEGRSGIGRSLVGIQVWSAHGRNQESVRIAKLAALELQQFQDDRIDVRGRNRKSLRAERVCDRRGIACGRQGRKPRIVNLCAR